MLEKKPLDPTLFELVSSVVTDAIERVLQLIQEGRQPSRRSNWPIVDVWEESGMPHIDIPIIGSPSAPPDYGSVFGSGEPHSPLRYTDLRDQQALYEYASGQPTLKRLFFDLDRIANATHRESIRRYCVIHIVLGLVDRYLQTFGEIACDPLLLLDMYLPLERYLLCDELQFDAMVPILCIQFDDDLINLGGGHRLERMPPDLQAARASVEAIWTQRLVAGLATHALVLPGCRVLNDGRAIWTDTSYPRDEIDTIFGILRMATGFETGYAQLIARPTDWARAYKAKLPPIEGTAVRAYPARFDDFQWLRRPALVTAAVGRRIAELTTRVPVEKRWRLALRRLNRCLVRDDPDDSLLDAVIGLETLLSDEEKDALSHKLAHRLATLGTFVQQDKLQPHELFKAVKQIYAARSKLVHSGAAALQPILFGGQEQRTDQVAVYCLRLALTVLLDNPSYLKAQRIDELALSRLTTALT